MFLQTSSSKVNAQNKSVSDSLDTLMRRLKLGIGRSVQNLSLFRNMSILRICVPLIVTVYGVRRFLDDVKVAETVDTIREGQGRHRMRTQREDRCLRNLALRNRQYTARRIQIESQHATGQRLSNQTIRNRLHEGDLSAIRPSRGPTFTRQHRKLRYEFAQVYQNWWSQDWHSSRIKADFTWVLVIDVSRSWEDPEDDTRTATFWKQTDMEEGRGNSLWRPNGLVREKRW